jgi:cysteine-rich repeat protein
VFVLLALCASCLGDPLARCPNGIECPLGKVCDGNGGCATQEQLDACKDQADLTACSVSGVPQGECRNAVCEPAECGNGVVELDEECDNGSANGDKPDGCRSDCRRARCGDHVVDTGEVCDDGNNSNGDGCSADCKSNESCGNGVIDLMNPRGVPEQCDAGPDNSDTTPDACRTSCQKAGCGDGIVDSTEQCDQGAANSDTTPDACRKTCKNPHCGDGVKDSNEACDTALPGPCSPNCRSDLSCGNAILDPGEGCDCGTNPLALPIGCNGINGPAPAKCSANCVSNTCGDSTIDPPLEKCDGTSLGGSTCTSIGEWGDKPMTAGLACSSVCLFDDTNCLRCGDGVLETSFEDCEGAQLNGQTCATRDPKFYSGLGMLRCTTNCTFDTSECAYCGDGAVNGSEECDKTNLNGMGCSNVGFYGGILACNTMTCKFDKTGCVGSCGDNVKNGTEQCDGGDFGTKTCADYGYEAGGLICTSGCTIAPPDTACYAYCGDATCGFGETCESCPDDCGSCAPACGSMGASGGTACCGNGHCDAGETVVNCPGDCAGSRFQWP